MSALGPSAHQSVMADQRLNRKIVATSLDLPWNEDEMDVRVNKGIGAGGAIGIALAAGLPGLVAVGLMSGVLDKFTKPPAAVSPADSEYDVRFYDADGKLINIPQRPTK